MLAIKGEIKIKRGNQEKRVKRGKKLSETSHPLCNNSVGNDFRKNSAHIYNIKANNMFSDPP